MHIGIASPISIQKFKNRLNRKGKRAISNLKGLKAPAVDTLVDGLLEEDHKVTIYTLTPEVDQILKLKGDNITLFIAPYRREGWKRAINFFKQEAEQVRKCIRSDSHKPEILHAHWTYEYALGVKSFRNERPVIISVRDWAPRILELNFNYYRLSRYCIDNYIFRFNNLNFISNSEYIKAQVQKKWNKNSTFIPNPVSNHFISKELDRNVNTQTIISISNNLSKAKNIKKLLKAFQLFLNEGFEYRLLLIGQPFNKENSKIQSWRKEGLLTNVDLIGYLAHDQLAKYYRKADLMVHPSLEESFGNTLIESMACKTPVIAGQYSGAVPYVLDQGHSGYLCNVSSPKSIKNAISKVISDENLRNNLIQNGFEKVIKEYQKESIVNKTLKYYKNVGYSR